MNRTLHLISALLETVLAALALATQSYGIMCLWIFCAAIDLREFHVNRESPRTLPLWLYVVLGTWNFVSIFQNVAKHDYNMAIQNALCVILVMIWAYQTFPKVEE